MSETNEFSGKVVIISGSSSGIGAGIAIQFSKAGAHVVVTGLEDDKVAEVAKQCLQCSPNGLKPLEVVADITKDDDCKRLIDLTIETFSKIDILVNNAGICLFSTIDDINIAANYDKIMNVNMRSVVYLTHLAVKHLEKTRGNIIITSSVASRKIFPMCFLYNMSKSAVDMFTRCMALELGPKGIRVNSVNPAAVNTNIAIAMGLSRPLIDQMFADQEKSIPMQRQGTPIDVANAVLFLASDKCSFVNGSNFFVDGGDAGKVVVITGSSSGIGAAAALQFSKSGAQVVITGRNAQNVSKVAKECQKISPKGLKALEVVMDVSKDEDCKRLIDSTIKSFGKLDILVNNAAKGGFKSISDPNIMDEFQAVMDTNLRSVVYLTHLSVEHLEKTKGNIINVSAVAGIRPSALDMFSRCLALELGPKGIRVNVVNPGAVRTNFGTAAGLSKPQFEFILNALGKSYPLGRVGESIDIANVILFLASDESSFV
ncbi:unnamed protein product, partial [Medioppia subpectinata]